MHAVAAAGKTAGFNLTGLAQAIGVDRSFLSLITTHRKPLPVDTAHKIAEVTKVEVKQLHYQSTYEMTLNQLKKENPSGNIEVIEQIASHLARAKHLDAFLQYTIKNADLSDLKSVEKQVAEIVRMSTLEHTLVKLQTMLLEEDPQVSRDEIAVKATSALLAFSESSYGKETRDSVQEVVDSSMKKLELRKQRKKA